MIHLSRMAAAFASITYAGAAVSQSFTADTG
jgi:hypothetical protein